MEMNKNDLALLRRARETNGGGFDPVAFSARCIYRMRNAGFIKLKPGYVGNHVLYILTQEGREALVKHEKELGEALDEAARKSPFDPPLEL